MKPTAPENKRWYQETGNNQQAGRGIQIILHNPVNADNAKEAEEVVKNYVDIIISKAEAIKYRYQFYISIPFQVIPVRVCGGKETANIGELGILKGIKKELPGVIE